MTVGEVRSRLGLDDDEPRGWWGRLMDRGLFGYRLGYIVVRPHVMLRDGWREIRWGIQRARRGYSDRDVWNLDCYLDGVLAGGLRKLANSTGYPSYYESGEKWTADLIRAAERIEAYADRRWETLTDDDDIGIGHRDALRWCVEHWGHLWD
jgi:hypothetical protein